MTTGKTIALTIQTFVNKVISLLFNMLSMFVIAFLPRSKCLLISWLHSPSALILKPKKIKSAIVYIFLPFYSPWNDGTWSYDLSFWMLSFKPAFSLSPFTFLKRLFCSCSISAIRVVSSAYLRLLIFLPTVLIPAYDSSCPAFHILRTPWTVWKGKLTILQIFKKVQKRKTVVQKKYLRI